MQHTIQLAGISAGYGLNWWDHPVAKMEKGGFCEQVQLHCHVTHVFSTTLYLTAIYSSDGLFSPLFPENPVWKKPA